MDILAEGGGEDHEHCKNCYRMKCTVKPYFPDSCAMIDCAMQCGMRLHKCKQVEHLEVCQAHRVPCINLEAGCPHVLPRRDLGRHLEVCPASVIHCTVEWNRWPVYSAERQARVPFVQDNLHARYGQLDVALALRDQRVLNEAMKAPRSTRRALRNPLTQRFPAVPLTSKYSSSQVEASHMSTDTSQTISDDDSDAPWEVRKNPPGLQRSICKELFKATRQITESLSAAISVSTEPPAPHMLAEIPEAYEQTAQDESTEEAVEEMEDSAVNNDGELAKTFSDGIKALEDGIVRAAAKLKESAEKKKEIEEDMDDVDDSRFNLQIDLNTQRTKITDMHSGSQTSELMVPEPPPVPAITLKQILALDLNIESITRYQAKPKSMYTFLCAQQFRRDEYSWHFKNVHSDIHGGLSGWLEHRCPLAHYGCTYSNRRLHPAPKGSKLVHNNIIEAFGVQPYVPIEHQIEKENVSYLQQKTPKNIIVTNHSVKNCTKESTPEILTSKDYDSAVYINTNGNTNLINDKTPNVCDNIPSGIEAGLDNGEFSDIPQQEQANCDMLTSLPFEILTHIAKFLDPFSLGNIALTSKSLREVACNLLETRGIVLLHWERQRIGDRLTWQTIYKRWMFSTAFTPIKEWVFEDNLHMGNHLQTCMFNRSEAHEGPVLLPSMESDDHTLPHVQEALKRMYPNFVTYQMMMENSLESHA